MKTNPAKKVLRLLFYALPLMAFLANLNERRAEAVSPVKPQSASVPVQVIFHRRYQVNSNDPFPIPVNPGKLQRERASALAVKAYVQNEAREHGVDPTVALWIVKHESQFNPRAKGDGEASRGLWQISKIYHPEVSDEEAFNVASSTEWSLERIRSGKVNEWSTYRFCRSLYRDCPF